MTRALTRWTKLLGVVLLVGTPSMLQGQPASPAVDLQNVREMYFRAVQDAASLAPAEREVDRLLETATGDFRPVLIAYSGALRTLRAKHGRWPPARLRELRGGLEVLDGVVARRPELAEPRYLRLMSCYYLPSILGRTESVREDFRALAVLLPGARDELPGELYRAIVEFVLENGELQESDRATLLRTLST